MPEVRVKTPKVRNRLSFYAEQCNGILRMNMPERLTTESREGSINLSMYLSIYQSIYLSICLFVCFLCGM